MKIWNSVTQSYQCRTEQYTVLLSKNYYFQTKNIILLRFCLKLHFVILFKSDVVKVTCENDSIYQKMNVGQTNTVKEMWALMFRLLSLYRQSYTT